MAAKKSKGKAKAKAGKKVVKKKARKKQDYDKEGRMIDEMERRG